MESLPKVYFENGKKEHYLISKKIEDFFVLPPFYREGEESILMVASSKCTICHDELHRILNKKFINIMVFVEVENTQMFISFKNEFPKVSNNIFPLTIEQVSDINVSVFPSYLHINSKGIITKVSSLADKAV